MECASSESDSCFVGGAAESGGRRWILDGRQGEAGRDLEVDCLRPLSHIKQLLCFLSSCSRDETSGGSLARDTPTSAAFKLSPISDGLYGKWDVLGDLYRRRRIAVMFAWYFASSLFKKVSRCDREVCAWR